MRVNHNALSLRAEMWRATLANSTTAWVRIDARTEVEVGLDTLARMIKDADDVESGRVRPTTQDN